MKELKEIETKEKSVSTANQNTFFINQFDVLARHSNGFDVLDYAQNIANLQCYKCNPAFVKPPGDLKLCEKCALETEQTENAFLDNFRRHRKVVKLDCFCFGCSNPKSSVMMSKVLPICRSCASEVQTKGAAARNNFINRAVNNFYRKLRRAAVV